MSFPPGTEMFQFPGFASLSYVFRQRYRRNGGLPHSEIHGSKLVRSSPWLIAAYHVLHRLCAPRHPPDALSHLIALIINAHPSGTEIDFEFQSISMPAFGLLAASG